MPLFNFCSHPLTRHESTTDIGDSIEELQRDLNALAEALKHNGDKQEAVRDKFDSIQSDVFKRLKHFIVAGQKKDSSKVAAIEIEVEKLKEENRLANQQTDERFDHLFQFLKATRDRDIETAAEKFSTLNRLSRWKQAALVIAPKRKFRGRMESLRREMKEISNEQERIRQGQREVRLKFEAIESVRESRAEYIGKQWRMRIREQLGAVEIECEQLKKETEKLKGIIDDRFKLFEEYLEATRNGDNQRATNVFLRLQRQIVAKRGKANSSA